MSFKTTNEDTRVLNHSNPSQMLPVTTDNSKNDQHANMRSLLGRAVFIKGGITAKEPMQINGRVEGTIALEEHKLEIGEEGRIHANIIAEDIIISGEVVGDVYAKQVMVTKTGRVTGNIYTPNFSMDEGAHIKGNIDMQKHDHLKQHPIPDMQDDNHAKGSGFGFLFKKGREVSPADMATTIQSLHENINVSDELIPLSVDSNIAPGSPYSERSVIGESVIINGEIISEEDVVIYGHIQNGIIYFKNNSLGIGPNAQIKANILVKSLLAHGEIKCDDIYASDRVILKKPAQVYAKIHAPRVSTENGAELNGGIDMAPQNIEEIFSAMGGSVTILEHSHDQEANKVKSNKGSGKRVGEDDESGQGSGTGSQHKDSAWPIFYPRT